MTIQSYATIYLKIDISFTCPMSMKQVKEKSIEADKITEILGEMPSPEEIKRMYNSMFKGITYKIIKKSLPQVIQ